MSDRNSQFLLVYDVGGSHVSAAVCASRSYALTGLSRAPLPADGDITPASFGRLIHTLGETAISNAHIPLASVAGASLAMPGPFDYDRGISQMQHKLPSLFGVDLKSALAHRFAWQPAQVRFVNDAAAFLLGEAGAGAAKGYPRSIGITLGTGIGCAFALSDASGNHIAPSQPGNTEGVPPGGEIWNLPYNGATVEDFVSTRYLRHHYLALSGLEAEVAEVAAIADCEDNQPCRPLEQKLAEKLAKHVEASNLAAVAAQAAGPARARKAFEDFGRHLGLALNQHAQAFHPAVVVLGGGISRASHLFLPATRRALAPGFAPTLAISALMDEAPLAGAGVHWFSN